MKHSSCIHISGRKMVQQKKEQISKTKRKKVKQVGVKCKLVQKIWKIRAKKNLIG